MVQRMMPFRGDKAVRQLDGIGVQRECLGTWGCRPKLILDATRNLEILKADCKVAFELAVLQVEGDQLKTVKGFLCFTEAQGSAEPSEAAGRDESGDGTGNVFLFLHLI